MYYEKQFNEIYAITALSFFWQDYHNGFQKSESPDWLHPEAGIGIEVSQALLPQDGQEERFIETYLGKEKTELPPEAFEKYGERLYFYNQRLWALLPDDNDEATAEAKILYRIACKTKKLNVNYQRCKVNALFLFTHTELDKTEAEKIFRRLIEAESPNELHFDLIFLDCKTAIYLLDFGTGKLLQIPIPEKARRFLEDTTENLRHEREWQNGDVFIPPRLS